MSSDQRGLDKGGASLQTRQARVLSVKASYKFVVEATANTGKVRIKVKYLQNACGFLPAILEYCTC